VGRRVGHRDAARLMADAAHLSLPLRLRTLPDGSRTLATDLQDSDQEISACIFAIANTRPGHRLDLLDFGTPRYAHRRGGVDADELERTIALWEPRADIELMRAQGAFRTISAMLEASLDVVEVRARS
jgi:hypothetical protein